MRVMAGLLVASLLLGAAGCGDKKDPSTANAKLKALGKEDVKVGDGLEARKGDVVYVLYEGTFENGKVFDSNLSDTSKVPYTFILGNGNVVKGWDEGIPGMKEGGERKLSIPASMGYGAAGQPPDIPANTDLFFTVRLLYVLRKEYDKSYDKDDIKPGTGPEAKEGDKVEVHYVGTYLNGKVFDDSRKRGKVVPFTIGKKEAIPGIDFGVRGMKVGGVRKITIPPALSFGIAGNEHVQGGQIVSYEVTLVSVNGKK